MIKVEALENFRFARYKEIEKTLNSKSRKEEGRIFTGDIFECTQEMTDYLLGDNPIKRAVVKVIEVLPEKETKKVIDEPVKKEVKKTTKSKKTIAKK